MEKYYNKQSLWSKILNFSFCFTNYKKISSSEEETKKFMENYSKKQIDEKIYKKHFIKEKISDTEVYIYNGKKGEYRDNVIIYIHGGSFIEHANKYQLEFAKSIAEKTNSTLILPLYELLPTGSCEKLLVLIHNLYREVMHNNPKKIHLLGDSAGGGTILSYSMILRDKGIRNVDNVIMVSPWIDLSMTNPALKEDEKKDTMNGLEGTKYAGKLWARNMNIYDPFVSPIYGNLNGLAKLTLIFGGKEILTSECKRFHEMLEKENIDHNYIIYEKEGHDFAAFPTKEGKLVIDDIANIINGS